MTSKRQHSEQDLDLHPGPDRLPGPAALAACGGWSEAFYRDLAALEAGRLTEPELVERHGWRQAILVVDFVGTTAASLRLGDVRASLRLLAAQRVALPLLQSHAPGVLRCFADNVVALFADARTALAAALDLQRCADPSLPECRFGIGYGTVLAIGPNRAQGAEMNQASKLGEDFARPGEILLTAGAHRRLRGERGFQWDEVAPSELPFSCYRLAQAPAPPRRTGAFAVDRSAFPA